MEANILNSGVDQLRIIKHNLNEMEKYKTQKKELDSSEKKLEKEVKNKEKAIADEISKAIKQRKNHIESTYDKPINEARTKIKKIQANRDKSKKIAVAERIATETKDMQIESKTIKSERKAIFKQEKISSIFNNRLFFALHLPKGFGDFVIILGTLIFFLFIIPCGVYFAWFSDRSYLYLALFYVIIIIVFGGLYLLTGKMVSKHIEALKKVRELRIRLSDSKRKQKRVQNRILHDIDETTYGLEDYNSETRALELEIDNLSKDKKAALLNFENEKRITIINEITDRNQKELDQLKSDYGKTRSQNKLNGDRLNALSKKIVNEYEVYLGKELMKVEELNQIERLMVSNNLKTIAEGKALYQKNDS